MYNLFFCLDNNYLLLLKYVFTTFIKFHDPKKFNLNFIIYDPDNNKLDSKIHNILLKISTDFNITRKYFIPTNEYKNLIFKYETLLFKGDENKKNISVFGKLANWSRFYINELYPNIKTGLYLDLDILFNKNIEGIFKTNITNSIVAISPHINVKGAKLILSYVIKHKEKLEETNILSKLNITFNDLHNNNYNCGVMYFNFELYKKEKILEKIIILLKYLVNVHKFIHGGTEKIQNVLIPNYNTFSIEYNSIFKYRKVDLNKNIIIHFKGMHNLLKNDTYLNIYDQIIKK